MRKLHLSCLTAVCASLMLGSCQTAGLFPNNGTIAGTSQQTSQGGSGQDILGSLLGGLLSNVIPLSEESISGTWTYSAPECRFESDNALAQAGGMVAAATVKEKLAETYTKLGIKPGACSFTFNKDKTCSVTMGGRTINGTYKLDASTHDINITSTTGLIKINGKIYFDGRNLALLFDANKLLSIAQTVSTFTGQGNSTIASLSSLLGQYKGMMVGMSLSK